MYRRISNIENYSITEHISYDNAITNLMSKSSNKVTKDKLTKDKVTKDTDLNVLSESGKLIVISLRSLSNVALTLQNIYKCNVVLTLRDISYTMPDTSDDLIKCAKNLINSTDSNTEDGIQLLAETISTIVEELMSLNKALFVTKNTISRYYALSSKSFLELSKLQFPDKASQSLSIAVELLLGSVKYLP